MAEALAHIATRTIEASHDWLDRSLYPFHLRTFATEHGRLSYIDEGAGPPVLLVHGTPSWSFEWRDVVRALAGSRRVIAPDHLGFGLSDKPPLAPYRPEDHARRLLQLFDALDLRDVTLVVHDFGGPIGLPIALDRPDQVARVVVVNSWMWPLDDDPRAARISRFVKSPLGRFLYGWINFSPRFLLPASFADRRRLSRAVHAQYLGPFARRVDRTAPWILGVELAGSADYYRSLWERRAALDHVPLTLVWGERDPFFDVESLGRWIDEFPRATVVRIAEAGHFPQEEAAGRVVEGIWR